MALKVSKRISGSALALCALVMGGLVGCAANAGNSSAGASTAGSAAAAESRAHYKALFESMTDPAPKFAFDTVSAPAPKGKTVDVIACPLPVCAVLADGVEEAAHKLGWTVNRIPTSFTPEGVLSALDVAQQNRPDVLIAPALAPLASIAPKLEEIKAGGILVFSYGYPDEAGKGSPLDYNVLGKAEFVKQAEGQVAAVAGLAGDTPGTVILTDASNPAWDVMTANVKKGIESFGGSVDVLKVSAAGKNIPGEVVTFLQSHPNVKYVLASADDLLLGVPEAVKSAGLEVGLIGSAPTNASIGMVESGNLVASMVQMHRDNGYLLIDAAARGLLGQAISDPNPAGLVAIVTKDNRSKFGDVEQWPGLADEFATTWGLK